MIKVNGGEVDVDGQRIHLLIELIALLKTFIDKGVCDKDDLNGCVKLATMSDKELDIACAEARISLLEFMEDLAGDLYEKLKEDDKKRGGTIRLV